MNANETQQVQVGGTWSRYNHYQQIRHTLKTGDILLFSGRGPFSLAIQMATRSPWSHVGMIVRLGDNLFLLESTTLHEDQRSGVQMRLLSERVRSTPAKHELAYRHLNLAVDGFEIRSHLGQARKNYKGRKYEERIRDLVGAAVDWLPDQEEDLSSIFCSELVAACLKDAGLLPSTVSASEFTPADFADDHINNLLERSSYQPLHAI